VIIGAALLFSATSISAETLKLLTWKGYSPKILIDKFKKETGIEVEATYSNNEEMVAKLIATRGGGFDLVQPSQDRITAIQLIKRIYQPIDYSQLKTYWIIPSMLEATKKNTLVRGESYGVPFCWGSSALIVNKKFAPDVKSFNALFDPKFKGRVSYRLKRPTLIAAAFASGTDPFEKYNNIKEYRTLMESMGQKLIDAKGLVKNYWTNGDSLLQSVRSGEVHVAMGWDSGGWKLHAENPDIDFVVPDTGALAWVDTFAIPSKAKNVSGAYQWINFMLRPDNAAIFTNMEKYSTASDGAIELIEPTMKANLKRSFTQADIDNMKWYPPVPSTKIESIEGKILDKVKSAQ
jgi:spermidine/putrescine transport system substrate-binding protein